MNIEPKKSIKLKKIDKNIPDINIESNNNSSNSFNITNGININANSNIITNNNKVNNINNNDEININNENKINQNDSTILDKEMTKIISNIDNNQEDWLEIKDDIIKDTNTIISKIKEQILSDFYDSSINENLNINEVINCIFKDDFINMFTQNSAFTRAFSYTLDEMIKSENININFSKYEEIKELIIILYEKIKTFDKWKNNLKKFNLELPEKIYRHTKNYFENYFDNLCLENKEIKVISLKHKFSLLFDDLTENDITFPNLVENEKILLIISLILPIIKKIELKNLDIFIKEFKKSIKNYYILFNVKQIIEKLHNEIESSINTNFENNTIEDIRKYITSRATSNSNYVNVNYEKIIDIIRKIFQNETIKWTKLFKSDLSLESLLFYYQNK
jgi:hypothetical protein